MFFKSNTEALLNAKFPKEAGPPTLAELDEFRIKNMPTENYDEILKFMLKQFGTLKPSTVNTREFSALDEGF